MEDNPCYAYEYSILDLFIPSLDIFREFCQSTDKTTLFIISVIRSIIMTTITSYVYDTIDPNSKFYFIVYLLIFMTLVNFIYISGVMSKKPRFTE